MISHAWMSKGAILCILAVAFIAAQGNAQDELENVLGDNGDFEMGFENWWQGIQGGAAALMEINTRDAIEGRQCAYVDVTTVTGTDWHVGLTHDLVILEANETYTFDFFAKADSTREISIEVKRTPGGGLAYEGVTSENYTINEEWDEYFKTFVPLKDYPDENGQPAQICFWVGQAEGEVWLDGVRVYWGERQDRSDIVPDISVHAEGKLITRWAAIKSNY
jgi:hypothetical protein